jgi:hypothetical protein
MSEVDRLSNSGLYPALPIADRRSRKDESGGQPPADKGPGKPAPKAGEIPSPNGPRPPKSRIDEYA